MTFYDFPAAHWPRHTDHKPDRVNFVAVRAGTSVTKDVQSRRRGPVMVYKLLDAAEDRWPKINSPELVNHARAGIEFERGIRVETRTDQSRDAAKHPNPIHSILTTFSYRRVACF